MRKLAALVFALGTLSSGAKLLHLRANCCCAHHHENDQDEKRDDAPCAICIAIHHVPVIALSKPATVEAPQDVGAWISPWISMVPEEVFFDRPFARGPPYPS